MTTERRTRIESKETLPVLPEKLGLTLQTSQEIEFQSRVLALQEAYKVREEFLTARESLGGISRQVVVQAKDKLVNSEKDLAEAKAYILPSEEDLSSSRDSIIKDRIRVKLASTKWRWYQFPEKIIYQILSGGGPLTSHPYLEPFTKAKSEAEEKVRMAEMAYQSLKEQTFHQQLASMDKNIATCERELIQSLANKVGFTREQTIQMLQDFPQFEEVLINAYIEKNAFSPNELASFDDFLMSTPSLRWSKLTIPQRGFFMRRKCLWVNEGRVPTQEEFKASGELIKLWKSYLRRDLMSEAGLN